MQGSVTDRPTTHLRLEHLGEPLVAALLTRISASPGLSSVPILRPPAAGSTVPAARSTLATALVGLSPPLAFLPDAQLDPVSLDGKEHRLDGKSRVDLAILDAGGAAVLVELKLGVSRLASAAFAKRFLCPCTKTHSAQRLSGKMCAILDGRFPATSTPPALAVRHDGSRFVARPGWGLVVRNATRAAWAARGWPPFERCAFVATLEDLAAAAGGPAVFDALVAELVGTESFAAAWGL